MKARYVLLDLLIILVLVAVGVCIWRPDWRDAALRAAPPAARSGVEQTWAKVTTWRPWERHTAQAPAQPAPPAASNAPKPDPEPSQVPSVANAPATEPSRQTSTPPVPAQERVPPGGNLPPKLPALAAAPAIPGHLRALLARARASRSPVTWRRLADSAAVGGHHAIAAEAYSQEAAIYRKQGDPNAALVESLKAGRHSAEGRLYLHVSRAPGSNEGLARLEPARGCLLGAFIDRDDQLPSTFMDENWQTHREPEEFEERVGKKHASLFCYLKFGRPFPFQWANRLRDSGIIPHLAWEPHSLGEVDESTVGRFADELARFGAPVFIRFAGEMNGDWTRYHGDPGLYREKFRLVYRIIHSRAPQAAVIWCVNTVPEGNIDAYYPGDEFVDWVGVNMYNVPFFDNDRTRPADHVHPADLLAHVYRKYSARKPIAICEYAASHQASVEPTPRPQLAITKIGQLYSALPHLYPRVKLVDWFDCNNLKHARPGRQLNNYSLTEDASILAAYRRAVEPSHYLGRPDDQPETELRPLEAEAKVRGVVELSAWVRAPLDRPKVYVAAGDQVLYAGDEPGMIRCRWDTRQLKPGKYPLRLLILDREGRKILERKVSIQVQRRG